MLLLAAGKSIRGAEKVIRDPEEPTVTALPGLERRSRPGRRGAATGTVEPCPRSARPPLAALRLRRFLVLSGAQPCLLGGVGHVGGKGDDPPAADDLVAGDLRLDQVVVDPGEGAPPRQTLGIRARSTRSLE